MRITSLLGRLPYGRALNETKDRLLSSGVRDRVNHLLKPYGAMLDLQINTTSQSISLSVLLKGEQNPVKVTVDRYEIISEEGKSYVQLSGVDTSREWLTALAREKLAGQKIPVPDHVSWLTKLLA
jgi:hypothetical protein